MPTEIDKIRNQLTKEEWRFLTEVGDRERSQRLDYLADFTQEERVTLLKIAMLTDADVGFIQAYPDVDAIKENLPYLSPTAKKLTDEDIEYIIANLNIVSDVRKTDPEWFSIGAKLSDTDLARLLGIATQRPHLLKPPKKEKEKVPEKPPKKPAKPPEAPTVEEAKEKIEEVREGIQKPWRTWFPFKTIDFIKSFLGMRGTGGAYPYEVFHAYKNALEGIIVSEEVRSMLVNLGVGIPVDGIIDHGLVERGLPMPEGAMRIETPEYHISEYKPFWNYFKILWLLGLIKKKGEKVPSPVEVPGFMRQFYAVDKQKEDSPMWKKPQEYAYPLAYLGKKRWDKLMELVKDVQEGMLDLDEIRGELKTKYSEYPEIEQVFPDKAQDVTVQWAFVYDYPEKVVHTADVRGLRLEEMVRQIVESDYKF